MTTVAYKQSCTVGTGMVYTPRTYPLSSIGQSPSIISTVNNAELNGTRPSPPGYYPMNKHGDFSTSRASYKKAMIMNSSNMYIAPQCSSSYIESKKVNTIGQQSYKQSLGAYQYLSYKGYVDPKVKYNPRISKRW